MVVLLCPLQFWNEQNGCGWTPDGCKGSEAVSSYVPWLKAWYTAMRAADPNAVLALGGENKEEGVGEGERMALLYVFHVSFLLLLP